jgi:outer membrane lipoprotein-sorting protein
VDFVHNGTRAWYYDSTTDTVTNLIPAGGAGSPSSSDPGAREPAVTPDQVAMRLLEHLTPSTTVHVATPVFVAGHPTYLLVLAPAAGTKGAAMSTVRQITIAVDTATGMPLRVQVYARGQSAPALQIGFKKVSFRVPAASEFAPLSGAHTQTSKVGGGTTRHDRGPGSKGLGISAVAGPDWGATATFAHVDLGRSSRQISEATVPVSGAFGTARLFQTSLVNALIFPDGRVVAGFVTPSALEAAAVSGSR